MKKRILTLLPLILIVALLVHSNGLGLFDKKTAYAVGDLNVIWGVPDGDPIFVVTDMLPGDMEDRFVDVENNAPTPRPVGVRGIKTHEIASFSAVLDFVISEGGNDLYGGTSPTGPKTLQEFFAESSGPNGIFLSTVNNGDTKTYNFKATFPEGSDNESQGAKVVFDLRIGISIAVPAACDNVNFGTNTIFGTSGNDTLRGTSKNELIVGFEGNDIITGASGNDCIIGGPGNDRIDAGSGNDGISGDEGNDNINASSGSDRVSAGDGNDRVEGSSGNDFITGDNQNDTLFGGAGNDTLIGGDGTDSAFGNTGTDACDAEVENTCEL